MTILQKSFQFQLYSCSMCTYTFTCTCTLRVHVPVNIVCKGLNGQIKRWITNNCEWVEHWNTLGKVWNEIPSCYWCVRLSHDLLSLSGLVIISSKEEDNNKKINLKIAHYSTIFVFLGEIYFFMICIAQNNSVMLINLWYSPGLLGSISCGCITSIPSLAVLIRLK